jgi:hypothetical protein
MFFNFFNSKPQTPKKDNISEFQISENLDALDEKGFSKRELLEYDKSVDFYYKNLINSLILFTYNSDELLNMEPILIDPLTELYEELDYAYLPVCFETIFRNSAIDLIYKQELLNFRTKVDEIPNNFWDYEYIDSSEKWKEIKTHAENLLIKLGVETREFNTQYHKIINSNGKTIFNGRK